MASSRKALIYQDAIENCFHPPFWTLCGLPLYFKFQTPSPVISIPVPFSVTFWQHPDSLQIGKVVFNQQLLLQHPDSLKTGKVVFNQWLPPHLSRVYHIFMFRCDQNSIVGSLFSSKTSKLIEAYMGEQDTSVTRAVFNRRKVTVKVVCSTIPW